MTHDETDTVEASSLDAKEAALKDRLRELVARAHDARNSHETADELDKEVRRVVLDLVELERERIEERVATAS